MKRTLFCSMEDEKSEKRRSVEEALERAVQEASVAAVEKARSYVTTLRPCEVDWGEVQ